ncbi:MAG: tRNA dihydrouridine(20/20a) synthase DusA [Acidobacteria bacterium]|nr:MAG: tRNA dihydrouridine(20/20a) synthase DusA [Acidobacteriota bacterium]
MSGPSPPPHRLSVAPMMARTDRHFRFFVRRLTRRTLLYTEMLTADAVLHGDRAKLLGFDPDEHPVALQLAGDDPVALAEAARIGVGWGYDEIDLNVGCPSERVQRARFGACLMAEPERVAEIVAAIRAAVRVPVTVKHRIGIDNLDSEAFLLRFVDTVASAGCDRFVVHARKAILAGLNAKQNRRVPPLRHDVVHRLKERRPDLEIVINGGIATLDEASAHLERVDGVMIGRAAYENPFLLAEADRRIFGETAPPPTRREVALAMARYVDEWFARGLFASHITRHILGLFRGVPGGRAWRRALTEGAVKPGADGSLIERALRAIPDEVLDARPGETERAAVG